MAANSLTLLATNKNSLICYGTAQGAKASTAITTALAGIFCQSYFKNVNESLDYFFLFSLVANFINLSHHLITYSPN